MWLLAWVTKATAVPNELCPGTCPDATACGNSADCGGESCDFPDACLPGLSDLIAAVQPELPDALNDYESASWVCGFVVCDPSPDELAFTSPLGITAVGIHDVTLPSGRTYLVRALLGADPGTYGYLDVVSSDVGANSEMVSDAPAPQTITLTVEVPESHVGPVQLRLHAAGPGWMHLSDIVIYELVDYGVWVRFAAPSAAAPVRFDDGWILRHAIGAGDTHGYYPQPCADGVPVEPTCIHPALTQTVALPGEFSPWLEVSAMFTGGWRASHAWDVTSAASGDPVVGATVQVQMAWDPDPDAVLWDHTWTLVGSTAGIVLPDGIPVPLDLLTHRGTIADAVLSDYPALLADPEWSPAAQPQTYWTGSVLNTIDLFDDYATVEDSLDLFRDIGFNRRSFLGDTPTPDQQGRAEAAGLTKDLLHGEAILAPWNYLSTDLDLVELRATADANLATPYYVGVAAGYESHPDDLFVVLGDEIGGLLLDGPLYTQGFRDFLKAQGFAPADFGAKEWEQLEPLPNLAWWSIADLRPDPLARPDSAKLFYWQVRWWNEATAQGFRVARDAVEQAPAFGAAYPMAFNSGTPLGGLYYTWGLGVEYQTMARNGAVTALLGEGFLLYNDMCLAQQLSMFADYTAAQARPWGLPKHGYLHAYRGDQIGKVLTLASRGYTYFDTYSYGPYDLSTGDGSGGLGALSTGWLKRVTSANTALAAVEPWLLDAARPPAGVAIVASQSDPLWTDVGSGTYDEAGWHTVWTHAHQPVDYIVEEQLAAELPGRSVLLLDRAHVSAAAWDAVQAWVEAGGTLVLGRGLARNDEYGQPVQARAEWLGVDAGSAHYGVVEPARVEWGGDIDVTTAWAPLTGGSLVAAYNNGQAAVVEVAKGKGRVVVVGFDLGELYLGPALYSCPYTIPPDDAVFPEGWSEVIRAAAGSLVEGVPREVDTDDPLVELQRLDRPGGGVIVAIAYSNMPLTATITADGLPETVTEALTGVTLPVVDGGVTVTLDHWAVLGWTDPEVATTDTTPQATNTTTEPGSDPFVGEPPRGGCSCAGGGPSVAAAPWILLAVAAWRQRRRVAVGRGNERLIG